MTLWNAFLQFTVPDTCLLCKRTAVAFQTGRLCCACWLKMPQSVSFIPGPRHIEGTATMAPYATPLGSVVRCAKYQSIGRLFTMLGERLGAALVGKVTVDVVTHVPIPKLRRWARGFDQSEILGRAISRQLGVDFATLLRRRRGRRQVGKTADERRRLSLDDFESCRHIDTHRVLLVDDVRTTGSTLSSAAAALKAEGVTQIWAATLCS